jgi:hypothetical protein
VEQLREVVRTMGRITEDSLSPQARDELLTAFRRLEPGRVDSRRSSSKGDGMRGRIRLRGRFIGTALALAAMTVAASAIAGGRPLGSVKQPAGKDGCYTDTGESQDGPGTCHDIRGGTENTTAALSPDNKFLYTLGYGHDPPPGVLSILHRRDDGTLKQVKGKQGCLSIDGSSEDGPGTCKDARDLNTGDGHSIAISKDGHFLYAASQYGGVGGVTIFKRDTKDGTLRQLKGKHGCVSVDGSSEDGPGTCQAAREADDIASVALTPDQHFLYASNYDGPPQGGIAIFRRSKDHGTLHQPKGKDGCVTQDGTQSGSAAVVCHAAPAIGETFEVGTPDNKFVYAPNRDDNLVPVLKRNHKGGLIQLDGKKGCISDDGSSSAGPNTCVKGKGLDDTERVVPSKDGRFLYVDGYNPNQLAVLDRSPKTGALSQRSGIGACITVDGSSVDGPGTCQDGRALDGGYAGDLSGDGKTLYFANRSGVGSFVIVRVNPKSGAFHQLDGKLGCVSGDGSSEEGAGTCQKGRAVSRSYGVTLGPRSRDVYVATQADPGGGVALFHAVTG